MFSITQVTRVFSADGRAFPIQGAKAIAMIQNVVASHILKGSELIAESKDSQQPKGAAPIFSFQDGDVEKIAYAIPRN